MTRRVRRLIPMARLKSQANITPLIDILLVLLVIFMVVTPTIPTGENAELPRPPAASQPKPKRPEDTLVLKVASDRAISLNRIPLKSTAELSMKLRDIFATRADRTIYVTGSKDLEFDDIAQIIDAARGGGADRIGLVTEEIH